MKLEFVYKNQKLIPLGVILLVMIVIAIPLKNTFKVYFQYLELQGKISKNSQRHVIVERDNADEELLQKADHLKIIFESLGAACQRNGVLISKIDLPKYTPDSNVLVETLPISLEGDFVRILKSLHEIAPKLKTVKISSIKFKREENNKAITLTSNIIFQSVKSIENEK